MDKKRSVGVIIIVCLKTIIVVGIMLIGIMSTGKWALSNQEGVYSDIYEDNCSDIRNIKSIVVRDDNILIEFDTSSGELEVHIRGKDGNFLAQHHDGTTGSSTHNRRSFSVKIGEEIIWGWWAGHYAFGSIKLEDIKDNVAFIKIGESEDPTQDRAFRKCKVYEKHYLTRPKVKRQFIKEPMERNPERSPE